MTYHILMALTFEDKDQADTWDEQESDMRHMIDEELHTVVSLTGFLKRPGRITPQNLAKFMIEVIDEDASYNWKEDA